MRIQFSQNDGMCLSLYTSLPLSRENLNRFLFVESIKLDQNCKRFVIETIRTDNAICASCKGPKKCFESFSLYSVKFQILGRTVVVNKAS